VFQCLLAFRTVSRVDELTGRVAMAANSLSVRETKRLQTRERLYGAAIAEFKRSGLAGADVGAIVASAGVAHGTFFFHFPTKEHVLLELENREEERMTTQLSRFVTGEHSLEEVFQEAVRLVTSLERRLGTMLFRDVLALHFSQTRPPAEGARDHPLIVLIAREIELAQEQGQAASDVNPMNSAVFFLLGLYAMLTTTNEWATRDEFIDDFVNRTLQSLR
jgi:AcrR family transcriptional regulator